MQMTIGERIEEHVIFQIKLDNQNNADNFIARVRNYEKPNIFRRKYQLTLLTV